MRVASRFEPGRHSRAHLRFRKCSSLILTVLGCGTPHTDNTENTLDEKSMQPFLATAAPLGSWPTDPFTDDRKADGAQDAYLDHTAAIRILDQMLLSGDSVMTGETTNSLRTHQAHMATGAQSRAQGKPQHVGMHLSSLNAPPVTRSIGPSEAAFNERSPRQVSQQPSTSSASMIGADGIGLLSCINSDYSRKSPQPNVGRASTHVVGSSLRVPKQSAMRRDPPTSRSAIPVAQQVVFPPLQHRAMPAISAGSNENTTVPMATAQPFTSGFPLTNAYLQQVAAREQKHAIQLLEARGHEAMKRRKTELMLKAVEEKPFACPVCNARFARLDVLKSHIQAGTHGFSNAPNPFSLRPFVCPLCSKSFDNKYNLRRHMMIHTGEKPFGCEICGKRFNQRSTYNHHKRRMH